MSQSHLRFTDDLPWLLFIKRAAQYLKVRHFMQRLARQSELLMIGLKSAHEANVTMVTDESSAHDEASGWARLGRAYRKELPACVVSGRNNFFKHSKSR